MAKISIKKCGAKLILFVDADNIEEEGKLETFCYQNEEAKCVVQQSTYRSYASL